MHLTYIFGVPTVCQTLPLPRLRGEPMTQTWPIGTFHSSQRGWLHTDGPVTQATPLKLKSNTAEGTLGEGARVFLWSYLMTGISLALLGITHG